MLDTKAEGYQLADLSDQSAADLISLLKTHWGYKYDQPFVIIGRLKEILSSSGGSFFVLEELHSINDASVLLYPLSEDEVRQNVFVGAIKNASSYDKPLDGAWVKARVKLSPKKEREKFKNPFLLQVLDGDWQLLQAMPETVANKEIIIDSNSHVEKWVVDFYWDLHRKSIDEAGARLQDSLKQQNKDEEKRAQKLLEETSTLSKSIAEQTESLDNIAHNLASTNQQYEQAESQFKKRRIAMDHQLSTLTQFVEQKANMLLELDLISQEEVNGLLGISSAKITRKGHDFSEIFSSDSIQAVSYIQAYMNHKGIIYSRKLLEDFYSLLTTHDLIVLAGDSGSGKTNLVKSFAEAIGGKAIVVPVKPNWTSSEDLLGYYNPLEQKYLTTQFLDALFEAGRNPEVPYLICLDEMNLARVEYYFADFLSLMEERTEAPQIHLYSDAEAEHLRSETRNFLSLIDEAKTVLAKPDLVSFLDLLRDESVNAKLHELCGFREGDSLLKYHSHLRKLLSSYLSTPSTFRLPSNVRIIGTINVDETTHYLSPKLLDRAHVMRFGNPLLTDWKQVEDELEKFELDLDLPIALGALTLGERTPYPTFDRNNSLVETLTHIVREYLEPLGIEFGLRTVRQARHYSNSLMQFGASQELVLNNIVLHKVLPKLMFDGEKTFDGGAARKDLLVNMRDYLDQQLVEFSSLESGVSCIDEFDRVIRNAENNDWLVNYWSR